MKIHITGRHLKVTAAIRDYVEEKVAKTQKFFNHIIWAQVVLSVEKRSHSAEIVVHAGRQTFRALGSGADLYAAIDLASDKIDGQLKKYKEKLRDHHKLPAGAAAAVIAPEQPGAMRFSIIKQVPLKPVSREEAVTEMDKLGYTFWMFLEKDSKKVQVIYRRQDDSYGLLQPVKWNGK